MLSAHERGERLRRIEVWGTRTPERRFARTCHVWNAARLLLIEDLLRTSNYNGPAQTLICSPPADPREGNVTIVPIGRGGDVLRVVQYVADPPQSAAVVPREPGSRARNVYGATFST
jgi:hypothetical protein